MQFEAYKNYQHQLGESLTDITEAFTQTFQEITGNGNVEQGLAFYKEVLGALLEGEQSTSELPGEKAQAGVSPEGEVTAAAGKAERSRPFCRRKP